MQTRPPQTHRCIAAIFGALFAYAVFAANLAPTVDAGRDGEYPSGQKLIYLEGVVQDDTKPIDSLVIRWRQIAGPAQAEILDSTSVITLATFPQIGIYSFLLFASDGALGATDTVIVKIRENLPFKVLAPVQDQQVQIGQPFKVRWQREPKTSCQVWYSIDGDLTRVQITENGAVASGEVTWAVGDTFTAGTRGIIIVHVYEKPADFTLGSFVLVDHVPQGIRTGYASRNSRPYTIGMLPGGRVRIEGPAAIGTVNLSLCNGLGRMAPAAESDQQRPWSSASPAASVYFYRMSVNGMQLQSGTLGNAGR